jgi:hypothetical protein
VPAYEARYGVSRKVISAAPIASHESDHTARYQSDANSIREFLVTFGLNSDFCVSDFDAMVFTVRHRNDEREKSENDEDDSD